MRKIGYYEIAYKKIFFFSCKRNASLVLYTSTD